MAEDDTGREQIDAMIRGMPIDEKVPVVALKKLLDEHTELDQQQNEEIEAINKKYIGLTEPLSNRASEIIKGAGLTPDELKYVEGFLAGDTQPGVHAKGSKIKHYWARVLENSKIGELITEDDIPALQALEDIRFSLEGNNKIRLVFEFSENPNFQAGTLNRELILENEEVVESRGDLLKWKPGKCLTFQEKTVTNKKTGEKKTTQGDQRPSVFHFFRNDTNKTEEEQKHLAIQQMIVNELTHDIIPYSLEFYLGLNADEFDEDQQDDGSGEQMAEEDEDNEEDKPTKKQHRP